MSDNILLKELVALRDEWQANADHLSKTIELLNSKFSSGSNGNGALTNPIQVSKSEHTRGSKKPGNSKFNSLSVDDRILSIIREFNRFVFREEIEQFAVDAGKPFSNPVASSLSAIKRSKPKVELVSIKLGHNSFVWGFKEWLNSKGEILGEHDYNIIG